MAESIAAAPNHHSSADAPESPNDDPPGDGEQAPVGKGRKKSSPSQPGRRKKAVAETRSAKEDEAAAMYAALQRTFAEHLAMVRAEFREAVANYSVRVQGLLTRIDESVADGSTAPTSDERARRTRALQDALKEIEALNLKPSKGRRRDLKRVEALAEHLGNIIDEW